MMERTRYDESFPLIKELANTAKAVLVTAHLGRPK
jgi:3-phosphoglycerate kinase